MAESVNMTTAIPFPKVLENYDSFTTKLENYLSVQNDTAKTTKQYVKALYDVTKKIEEADRQDVGDALPELIIENFDEEQIWQQIELQNEARLKALVGAVASLVARKDRFSESAPVGSSQLIDLQKEDRDEDDLGNSDDGDDEGEDEEEEESDEEDDNEIEKRLKKILREEQKRSGNTGDSEDDNEDDDGGDDLFSDKPKKKLKPVKVVPSEVDDKFFKLSEMENYLDLVEKDENPNDSDDSIDLLKSMSSDEDSEDEKDDDDDDDEDDRGKKSIKYSDFFDAPRDDAGASKKSKRRKEKSAAVRDERDDDKHVSGGDDSDDIEDNDDNEDEEVEDDDDDARNKNKKKLLDVGSSDSDSQSDEDEKKSRIKSTFETRQERLNAKIKRLEEELIQEKPWQLKGEASARSRPENALLEEDLEFDQMTREAPIVTEKTSYRLEDIIKQRIKDKSWDDVERKVRPTETPSEYKKKLVLDQEKSKLSLAQIYEQDYLNKVAEATPNAEEKPEEIPKEHQEITAMANSLFRKLDALCNFHFTPKMITPEAQIITNVPAIQMEEVAPVSTSDGTLLAPEEIRKKPRGDVIGKEERTVTDKHRERRLKKQKQRMHAREKEKREAAVSKLRPGLGNKYSKEKAIRDIEKISKDANVDLIDGTSSKSATKSSKAFFTQLQDEVKSQIKQKTQSVKRAKPAHQLSAKRIKL